MTVPGTTRIHHLATLLLRTAPLLFAVTLSVQAQDAPTAPALIPAPSIALRAFEQPAGAPYQLGRGDEISVEAAGRPELTGKHIIGPDGKITMPIAGSVEIADLTRDQAAGAIEHALDPYYTSVVISVGIDKYTSNEIIVLGAVSRPGVISFNRTPTLMEAVSRANGGSEGGGDIGGGGGIGGGSSGGGGGGGGGNGGGIPGQRPTSIPEEVTIYRGTTTMVTVQLRALVESGDPLANMRLKRDDIIYVSGKTSYVSVFGQVYRPGNLHLEKGTTLADLLAQAGGPTEKAGHNPSLEIIHQVGTNGPSVKRTITFRELREHKSIDLTLQSGDIIYVPESGFNNFSYTMQQISPLVNLFTVASILGGSGSSF